MKKYLISLSAAAFLLAGCQTTSVNHLKTEGRIYFQYDQVACEEIEFECSEGYESFSDKTGCGCQLTPVTEEAETTEPSDEQIDEDPVDEDTTDVEDIEEDITDEEDITEEETVDEDTEDTSDEEDAVIEEDDIEETTDETTDEEETNEESGESVTENSENLTE